jgi:hypothetical protein
MLIHWQNLHVPCCKRGAGHLEEQSHELVNKVKLSVLIQTQDRENITTPKTKMQTIQHNALPLQNETTHFFFLNLQITRSLKP